MGKAEVNQGKSKGKLRVKIGENWENLVTNGELRVNLCKNGSKWV